jgi:hypothetical protein
MSGQQDQGCTEIKNNGHSFTIQHLLTLLPKNAISGVTLPKEKHAKGMPKPPAVKDLVEAGQAYLIENDPPVYTQPCSRWL